MLCNDGRNFSPNLDNVQQPTSSLPFELYFQEFYPHFLKPNDMIFLTISTSFVKHIKSVLVANYAQAANNIQHHNNQYLA
jgi:hypothetical protein